MMRHDNLNGDLFADLNPQTPRGCRPRDFVRSVMNAWRDLPGARPTCLRDDRAFARRLHRDAVPLEAVEAAMLLATCRRHFRDQDSGTLPPIRSLRYFLPVIHEVLANPLIDDLYLDYLRRKVADLIPFAERIDP